VGKVFHFTFFLNPGTGERYSCPEALRRIATQCQGRCDTEARHAELLRNVKAVVIQKHVRRWLQVKKYRMVLRGIVLIQSHFRRRKARLLFKMLKVGSSECHFSALTFFRF